MKQIFAGMLGAALFATMLHLVPAAWAQAIFPYLQNTTSGQSTFGYVSWQVPSSFPRGTYPSYGGAAGTYTGPGSVTFGSISQIMENFGSL